MGKDFQGSTSNVEAMQKKTGYLNTWVKIIQSYKKISLINKVVID